MPVPPPAAAGPFGDLPVTGDLAVPDSELRWRFSRSGGPGGQGVNTTDSRVELSWDVAGSPTLDPARREQLLRRLAGRLAGGVLTVSASRFRAQLRNRQDARERLARLVAAALAPPAPQRRATRATRGSQRRRLDAKRRRGETKRLRRSVDD